MTGDTEDVWDPREVARGRALNELFDAQRDAAEGEFGRSSFGSASRREMRECAGMLRDLGLAAGRLDALIAHGIFEKSEDDAYPARFGFYKVVAFLGRGGMGLVFKAFDEKLRRPIALKLLRPELCHEARTVARFTREAQAAARLNHPNIVGVYDVGEHAGVHYIAMEYVDGPSLAEAIKGCDISAVTQRSVIGDQEGGGADPAASAPRAGHSSGHTSASTNSFASTNSSAAAFSPAIDLRDTGVIRSVFRQLLQALAAAHEAGLIHRDVKSSNILLSIRTPSISAATPAEGGAADVEARIQNAEFHLTVKLADFGLARMADSQTRMTAAESIMGTPEYMSPEQARGDAEIDHRTDLYSAGVVLYEMLTGRTPFEAATPTGVIHLILNVAPLSPRTINPAADPALGRLAVELIEKRVGVRCESAGAALRELAGESSSSISVTRRWLRRNFVQTSGVVITAILIVMTLKAWPAHDESVKKQTPILEPVTAVKIDDSNPLVILIRRGYTNAGWMKLDLNGWPPASVERLCTPQLLYIEGVVEPLILTGVNIPIESKCFFVFDDGGNLVSSLSLTPPHYRDWPDGEGASLWSCREIVVADFDGDGEEEVAALAGDLNFFQTGITLIEPREWKIERQFWHTGGIDHLKIASGFIDDGGRPALCAYGVNNKLDGLGDPVLPDYTGPRFTEYGIVSVVMILDPMKMGGMGPPNMANFDSASGILAYAFLDMPSDDKPYYPDGAAAPVSATEDERMNINNILPDSPKEDASDSYAFRASLGRDRKNIYASPGMLRLDRGLRVQETICDGSENDATTLARCRKQWRILIQDNEGWRIDNSLNE